MRLTLPEILQAGFQGGLDLERAHRSLLPSKSGAPPRPFIVRFIRCQQKEQVRRLAREIGAVRWQNHMISVYQDFSKATQECCHSFLECKGLLHTAKIPFGIGYPAVLSFTTASGIKHRFHDPKKALECIKNLWLTWTGTDIVMPPPPHTKSFTLSCVTQVRQCDSYLICHLFFRQSHEHFGFTTLNSRMFSYLCGLPCLLLSLTYLRAFIYHFYLLMVIAIILVL